MSKKPVPSKSTTAKKRVRKTGAASKVKKPAARKSVSSKDVSKDASNKTRPAVQTPVPVDDGIHPVARPFLWLGTHKVQKGFIWVVLAAMLLFMGLDLTFHRHGHFSWEERFGFYGFFGFAAFTLVVLCGWPLRRITGRDEQYYQEDADDV